MKNSKKMPGWVSGIFTLIVFFLMFGYLGSKMGAANMLNTIMNTSHDLLLNTVFYLMAICVITGAIGKIFLEFGVVKLLEKLLRPLMKPLFNLPGVASLGAVLTFLSDNPAVISLAQDKRFATYFKKFQLISLTNFGTAFGMGLLVIVFMVGYGYFVEPIVGLFGAFVGCIVSTRLMQRFVVKAYPAFKHEQACEAVAIEEEKTDDYKKPMFQRILDSLLDGGRSGVDVGIAIIPGVLIISTLVMLLTFGSGDAGYTGEAYQGVELLPWVGEKLNFIFEWLFGFVDPHLIAFPITALGAVGAALGLVPNFAAEGWIDGNAIAVFTAIGMCWSGYLSTHTAMLDTLGYRKLTSKAILAHTVGGFVAGIVAHWVYVLVSVLFLSSGTEAIVVLEEDRPVEQTWVAGSWDSVEKGDVYEESPLKSGMLHGSVKLELTQAGDIVVNFKNNKENAAVRLFGADVSAANGMSIISTYKTQYTNDSTGCSYRISQIPAGVCEFNYYVVGNEGTGASSGTMILEFESRKSIVANELGALIERAKDKYLTAEYDRMDREQTMLYSFLHVLCDKYEELLKNPAATVGELEAACSEMRKLMSE